MAKYMQKREQSNFKSVHDYVLYFFKIMFEWEDEMKRRDQEEKRTMRVKRSYWHLSIIFDSYEKLILCLLGRV